MNWWMAIDVVDVFFVDDTIIFFAYDCAKIVNLRCVLIWFEAVSRLRVSFCRNSSSIVEHADIIQLLCTLGCICWCFLTSSRGLPLFAKFKEAYLGISC